MSTYKENKTITRTFITVDKQDIVKAFSPDQELTLWDVELHKGDVILTFGKVIELSVEK